jgi:hypothetical protein
MTMRRATAARRLQTTTEMRESRVVRVSPGLDDAIKNQKSQN